MRFASIPVARSPICWSRTTPVRCTCSRRRRRLRTRSRGVIDRIAGSGERALAARSPTCWRKASASSTARPTRSMRSSPATPRARRSSPPRAIRDMLVLREGGRAEPFNYTVPLSRAVRAALADLRSARPLRPDGSVFAPFDEAAARRVIARAAGERDVRPSPFACSGRSSTRRTSCGSAPCSKRTCRACPITLSHQLNPDLARIPARLLGRASTRR